MPDRFGSNRPQNRIPDIARATKAAAPAISRVGTTLQDSLVSGDLLAEVGEVEVIESAEQREVGGGEGRLGHVQVFRVDCVGISIVGTPPPLSRHGLALSKTYGPTLSSTKSQLYLSVGSCAPSESQASKGPDHIPSVNLS